MSAILVYMNSKKRMDLWVSLPDPKPSWETFKRLIALTNGDVDKALEKWLWKQEKA